LPIIQAALAHFHDIRDLERGQRRRIDLRAERVDGFDQPQFRRAIQRSGLGHLGFGRLEGRRRIAQRGVADLYVLVRRRVTPQALDIGDQGLLIARNMRVFRRDLRQNLLTQGYCRLRLRHPIHVAPPALN
jgi:hypothetical protein